MPIISIIIPVYNVEEYLDETFLSLLQQDMTDFEIIAVNDGSKDNSLKIIQKYAAQDSRIKLFSQSNQGQSAARNLGMHYATGKYIFFMDSDDRLEQGALMACYKYIEHSKADFIFFDGDLIYEDKAYPIPWNYKRTYLCQENISYQGESLLRTMLDTGKHNCVVWLLFIRKTFLDSLNLHFFEGIIHEDELFTTILTLSSNNIYCLKRSLIHHRIRRTSTMGTRYSKRNIICYLTVADELLRFQKTPIIHKFLRYTLSKVFYTGHIIPYKEKPAILLRAIKSNYLKYIGVKSTLKFLT